MQKTKRIAILGSTGSVGKNVVDVITHLPIKVKVIGLSTKSNINTLYQQIRLLRPSVVCISDIKVGVEFMSRLKENRPKVLLGPEGLEEMLQDEHIDEVVVAISGSDALNPILKAIDNQKDIILANKEALVMAGSIIMDRARQKNINLLPVDSEQSAIWQCLDGKDPSQVKNIYLTASGGPFLNLSVRDLKRVSKSEVLNHPRWKMGKKITVDSATLMNKGLEVLETMLLFNINPERIKVLIHPEAIVHSMVEFIDGVVIAQLSITDMRIPIQYALSYPERLVGWLPTVDFYRLKKISFQKPDFKRFPCLELAYHAAKILGTLPCVMNAANEVGVARFLEGKLNFYFLPEIIRRVMESHRVIKNPDLNQILQADVWARKKAVEVIENLRDQ
ncbi:MAG: 1-deoxy-D-xylulose-5-phosphate reductoisomerase [Candidatus Omnitrophica bacterium]|nr:1-deoxy-D-xylulose-5-phosphate reductoisomerase [Candidatus Omnitrophota bacterium]